MFKLERPVDVQWTSMCYLGCCVTALFEVYTSYIIRSWKVNQEYRGKNCRAVQCLFAR